MRGFALALPNSSAPRFPAPRRTLNRPLSQQAESYTISYASYRNLHRPSISFRALTAEWRIRPMIFVGTYAPHGQYDHTIFSMAADHSRSNNPLGWTREHYTVPGSLHTSRQKASWRDAPPAASRSIIQPLHPELQPCSSPRQRLAHNGTLRLRNFSAPPKPPAAGQSIIQPSHFLLQPCSSPRLPRETCHLQGVFWL